jgi:hypothetical protein
MVNTCRFKFQICYIDIYTVTALIFKCLGAAFLIDFDDALMFGFDGNKHNRLIAVTARCPQRPLKHVNPPVSVHARHIRFRPVSHPVPAMNKIYQATKAC